MAKNSFEQFIIHCCRAREWNLRKFLKKILPQNGFRIIEDDYKTYRGEKYNNVHNMLAIRGNPKVCLVAHTDVCRDHVDDNNNVEPIVKLVKINDTIKSIIQDRDCKIQVGGDDRLGVAINTWVALNTGYDMGLLFTTDEEIGLVSAEYVKFPELLEFDLLAQVDRGNHSDQLVTSISGRQLCSDATSRRLLKISKDIGLERYAVNGFLTDVLAIKQNRMCKDAVNMTCGYHNSYGAEKDEYIDIQEAKDTMHYVSKIVQSYYLNEEQEDNDEDMEALEMELAENAAMISRSSRKRHKSRLEEIENLFSDFDYENEKSDDNDWREINRYR